MKITLKWLKEFLDTNSAVDEIVQKLTSLGLEVDGVTDKSLSLKDFIVAEIKSAIKHPTANKLQVCEVFDGKYIISVVCGAPNARAGIKVVLAPEGTVIPLNGMIIKKSKIREVESYGMLCSAAELMIDGDEGGIIELDPTSPVGESFVKILGLDDQVIEISITPNRGDCLGVYGIARELAAAGLGTLKNIDQPALSDYNYESPIKVSIDDESGCERFAGRYFKDIKNPLNSPDWMSKNLKAIGSKTISTLVDITNLICFSFARPLHIFDADKIHGNITVRQAKTGEKFLALNDIEYKLIGDEIVICDNSGVIALAGIIGGKSTSCDVNTKNAFLEIALFDSIKISKAARHHQIDTDSKYRFERKLDPSFIEQADLIATNLIHKLCGGTYSSNVDEYITKFKAKYIDYSLEEFYRKAGFEIAEQEIITILHSLGFKIQTLNKSEYQIEVPSWRNDIEIAEDLTEEILRVYGYDKIPTIRIPSSDHVQTKVLSSLQNNTNLAKRRLASLGYYEIVSWSFMSHVDAGNFVDLEDEMRLLNPISEELSYMRPTIIPNILLALKNNLDRGFDNLSFFEIGPVFANHLLFKQQLVCCGVRSGLAVKKNIHAESGKFDVFDIKRDVFSVISEYGFDPEKLQINQDSVDIPKWYHPMQSCALRIGKVIVGYFGKIHPAIIAKYQIDENCYAFELFPANLPLSKAKHGKRSGADFSDYQAVKRDFAFILDKNQPAGSLIKIIENVDKKLIKDIKIFDCFMGKSIGEDKKSIALAVILQASDRTLVESEIEIISNNIVQEVKNKLGGILRS